MREKFQLSLMAQSGDKRMVRDQLKLFDRSEREADG